MACGRRLWSVALLLALASVLGVAGAAAAGAPTGNQATIAFYRQVAAAYTSVHAITATRHGFLAYEVAGTSYRYTIGERPAPGFVRASESLLYVLRAGKIVTFVDVAHAPGRPALTYIEDASGAWSILATQNCFSKNPRLPGFWAHPFVGLFGNFAPLRHSGSTVVVRSTYPWGSLGQMTEVDHIAMASKFFTSISGALAGSAGFSWSITSLRNIAAPSQVLQPTPHC